MGRRLGLLAVVVGLVSSAAADIIDDFSGGDWSQFRDTPGLMTATAGALRLADAPGEPSWITAHKVFEVNVDATPFFLVDVGALTHNGTVKLIRLEPFDKREVLSITQPGLHALNLTELYGWRGTIQIDTCLYGAGEGADITYRSVRYAAALTPADEAAIAERESTSLLKSQLTAPLELVPSFVSCSYYFQTPELPAIEVAWRPVGQADWQAAYPPAWFAGDQMYRGSLVRLAEDTPYEFRITDGAGRVLAAETFRTWSSHPPIARTITLDEATFPGTLRITDQGTPDGWIRYTAPPGTVLRNDGQGSLLVLDSARYVILEGLTLRGGAQNAVELNNCHDVRVTNCDIAGWGRVGVQRFDRDGKFFLGENGDGGAINWDTGILVRRSHHTVIERCYVHDPLTTANSWYYSHPAGPQAVGIDKPSSTVIRYNDFVGSDEHRWNDAIEGAGNFEVNGGFNRDADIYGEFHAFANDDAIEIDGGQINVRVFDNKFEGCLCGVSVQGCMTGPSYVFNNLLVNMGDERNYTGQTIKTSSNVAGPEAVTYLFHNTCWGEGYDLGLLKILKVVAYNNIFAGRSAVTGRERSPQSEVDYNLQVNASAREAAELHGVVAAAGLIDPATGQFGRAADSPANGRGLPLANFSPDPAGPTDMGTHGELPFRPIPVSVPEPQVSFSLAEFQAGTPRTVTATVGGDGFSSPWRIAQNDAFDWFTVSPASGTLASGDTLSLTVTLHPERMPARALYKGAFLIRLADGFSRPVLVYAQTPYRQPVRPARDGAWAAFIEAEAPTAGRLGTVVDDAQASGGQAVRLDPRDTLEAAEFRFTVPHDATVYLQARLRVEDPAARSTSVEFSLDDETVERGTLRASAEWSWSMMSHARSTLSSLQSFPVKAGEHTLRLRAREVALLDLVALTDDPKMFE